MLLQYNNQKYTKKFKIKRKEKKTVSLLSCAPNFVHILSLENQYLSTKTLESFKKELSTKMKKTGKVFINANANLPITRKPKEVRMGKGKGSVSHWVCPIKAGQTIAKIAITILNKNTTQILQKCCLKLPVKTRLCY